MRRSSSRLISAISLVSATALVACSGGTNPTPVDSGMPPADTGVVEDTGVGPTDTGVEEDAGVEPDAGEMSCIVEEQVDTTPDPSCTGEWVATIGGVLQEDDATPIRNGRAQVCIRTPEDILTCLRPKESCSGGEWEVLAPNNVRCVSNLVMHSFKFDGPFADTYCNFEVAGLGPRVTLPDPVPLYRVTPAVNLPPLGDENTARTVSLAGDLDIDVTPSQIFEGYENLGAARVAGDVSPRPCFYPSNDDFDAMWGFRPSINISGPTGYPFRIANTGLAQGASVDLYVLGSLDCQLDEDVASTVEEGHWEMYSTVTVGADGSIAGDLPCFNWFAYKAR